jgi:hypothetical protein
VISKRMYSVLLVAFVTLRIAAQEPITTSSPSNAQMLCPGAGPQASNGQQFLNAQPTQSTQHQSARSRAKQTIRQMLSDRTFLVLSSGVYAGTIFDIHTTVSMKKWYNFSDPPSKVSAHFSDPDPLARPFVNLPNSAYYASGLVFATGLNLVAWKLKQSSHFRKVWWLPQIVAPGLNFDYGINNINARNYQINFWKTNSPHR